MAAVAFNGQVIGLSALSSSSVPVAFCRAVTGGTFSCDFGQIVKKGVGAQKSKRKGTTDATIQFSCVGVSKTDVARWFPTTAGAQVAAFLDFLVEVDDGTNGLELKLTSCQPGACTIAVAENDEITYDFEVKVQLVTSQAAGTAACAYTSLKGHTINDVTVEVSSAAFGVMDFSIANGMTLAMHNPMDGKTATLKTWPVAWVINTMDPVLSMTTDEQYNYGNWWDDTNTEVDVVIGLVNGTSAENVTITCDNFSQDEGTIVPLEPEPGVVGFPSTWSAGSGKVYNRVQFA